VTSDAARSWHDRTRLRWPASVAERLIAIGAIIAAGAAAVLGDLTEDVVGHDGITRADPARLRWFVAHRTTLHVHTARHLSYAGMVAVVNGVAVLASALLWWRGLPLAAALAPLAAVAIADVVAALLKVAVGRTRPSLGVELVHERDWSFPSGHATGSMALCLSVAAVLSIWVLRRPILRALTLAAGVAVPIAIGLSRLELGVHWPTDVVAGLALGTHAALAPIGGAAALLARPAPEGTDARRRIRRRLVDVRSTPDHPR
jgi:undecaprenyl-diphosphatase